jgi:F-type H+-transporting ATPase subunit alpha
MIVDTILNQRDSGVQCVYVAVGQKKSSTLAVIETLRSAGALAYTIVVMSSPDDPPALRYLAPYSGCTMAEHLMHMGRDVLVVYDDLSKHADAYRELSLLLRRPPGREAYPGDIFYLHARLLERACKLSETAGGTSLTALPVVEIQQGDISAYIPTNLISITDGQIVLDAALFNQGVKPAVDIRRSVSRVGGAAQTTAMRAVAGKLRLELAQFEEVARFARFGTEVDETTQRQIQRGQRVQRVLTQPAHQPLSLASQVAILFAATEGYLDDVAVEDIAVFERELLTYLQVEQPNLLSEVDRSGALTDEIREVWAEEIEAFRAAWFGGRLRGLAEGGSKR